MRLNVIPEGLGKHVMLITNQNNAYLINRMETFETVVTPIRRNVARKSTANRPLHNRVIKAVVSERKHNLISSESLVSKSNDFDTFGETKTFDNDLTHFEQIKSTPKTSLLKENRKKYFAFTEKSLQSLGHSKNKLIEEYEDDDLTGIFCVSDEMSKYLNDSMLSPSICNDSSDESIDLSRVINYPVKTEKCSHMDDKNSITSLFNHDLLQSEPIGESVKSIKQELITSDQVAEHLVIGSNYNVTELATQTKKCLFDPNLESVTCKVKVREELLVCENRPVKMTILEANFDPDFHLKCEVDTDASDESENIEDDKLSVPQLICSVSLKKGNYSSEDPFFTETIENGKIVTQNLEISPKSLKDETLENNLYNEKRRTRSMTQMNNISKRVTRNSTRSKSTSFYSEDHLPHKITLEHDLPKDKELDNSYDKLKLANEYQSKLPTENVNISSNSVITKELDCKKKNLFEKKGKKEINEGVLLHVEATKETQLMKDGKIVKEKEEYLKDIESKIDNNLPVVVEKEFDIQQSLTEEILLDQALRLAHQRTSPRLSKAVKEAIIKASNPPKNRKAKQSNKIYTAKEKRAKQNKLISKSNSSEALVTTDSQDIRLTVESATNNSLNLDLNHDEKIEKKNLKDLNHDEKIEKRNLKDLNHDEKIVKENLKDLSHDEKFVKKNLKKKKKNCMISPKIKKSLVEPLTIKICRKGSRKKSAFRLSLKKKKKNRLINDRPVVDMDNLSKTFEDVLQDENWSSDYRLNTSNLDDSANNGGSTLNSLESKQNEEPSPSEMTTDKSPVGEENIICNEVDLKSTSPSSDPSAINSNQIFKESSEKDSEIPFLGETNVSNSIINTLSNSSSLIAATDQPNLERGIKMNDDIASNINHEHILMVNQVTVDSFQPKDLVLTSEITSPSKTSNSLSSNCHNSSTDPQCQSLIRSSNHQLNEISNKPIFSTNMVGNHNSNTLQTTNCNSHCHDVETDNKFLNHHQDQVIEHKGSTLATAVDSHPKVLPLSIASRDPRLRKSHVKVFVEVSTSSVSSNLIEKPNVEQETRIISHVLENLAKKIDYKKGEDSDSEIQENSTEIERKKKFKKREVDAELLYKTPLSDLHDLPERSSYARSNRKRSSPPKSEVRESRFIWRRENNFFPNANQELETHREYYETSKMCSTSSGMLNSDEYNRSDSFNSNYGVGQYGSDPGQPDHYNLFRNSEYSLDIRRESYVHPSFTENIHEIRHSNEFTGRHKGFQNHPDTRISYQLTEPEDKYKWLEADPPAGYPPIPKRANDFNLSNGNLDTDFRDRELIKDKIVEKNIHNQPSYSRWDYAHKRVSYIPPEVDTNKKQNQQSDEINAWEEERDLIDGPVKNFTKPYYRRKKLFKGDDLFERRTSPWNTDNRRYSNGGTDRNYEKLWDRKTDEELIHGPERERWDRRGRKGFRDERSRSPRRVHGKYPRKRSRSPGNYIKSKRETSVSPHNKSPLILDSPMSPEPEERFCVLEPTKCLTVPQ